MKQKRYLTPTACSFTELETEYPILASSKINFTVAVDPLEEHYFEEGNESTYDHLIEF